MGVKVCKFGGTSLADGKAITNVAGIIKKDGERRFIIVSAPGKREKSDIKITDMLFSCCDEFEKNKNCDTSFSFIADRYREIIKQLNIDLDIEPYLAEIKQNINESDRCYAASRGEYLNGLIISASLGYTFVDAAEIIKFNSKGVFDSEYTNDVASKRLKDLKNAVIPGFYGSMPDGKIKTFSRGGSDITGAIIARALDASLYENWTDVDGFLTADPGIVKNPQLIEKLSYRELRELSYMGASVLHSEAVFPVRSNNIPIEIKNTFNPDKSGTKIVSGEKENKRTITGIAGKKNFSIIFIEKQMMNAELGFCRKVLTVLERNGISVEHIPTGIDTMCVVTAEGELNGKREKVIADIKGAVNPDNITFSSGLALIAIVGHGMQQKIGTAGRLCTALGKHSINIRMIDQGSSELNIIVGVNNEDYEGSVRAIYEEFLG